MHLAIILSMQLYTTMIIKWPSCSQKWGINWSTACDPIVSMMEQLSHDEMIAYLIFLKSLKSFLGEDKLKEFINFTLHYIAGLDISIKRIAAKKSMMNLKNMIRHVVVLVHNIRPKMISVLREKFAHMDLTFSIGGQISFDGGNDYEIYESERTVGHTVTSPDDTAAQCRSLFLGN
ncbi:phosphomannomutase [Musa troglodytarum]|uniref:Phosphomannomutase n=1 Tax=Musa troglodytarum TaxID=320322 RepID=A0A9E7HX78_9LILI|nr:phosphomannomutase [Musa troglodytarum]